VSRLTAPVQSFDVFQLTQLEALTNALAQTNHTQRRLDAAMQFFVPRVADTAYIALNDDHGVPHIAAGSSPGGFPVRTDDSYAVIGLAAPDGSSIGSLHLRMNARPEYATDAFLDICAARTAQALYNALLFEREQRVSLTFQNAAVSVKLPNVPGYAFDATYQAGRSDALIGGDWYDAFLLGDGRFIISVGDVQGSGLEAAVAMVSVRQTLRGVAHIHADPVIMLEAADRTLQQQFHERFVTTFVAVVDPVTQSCTYANAGHPPPLLRLDDGAVLRLSEGGIPLGVPGFTNKLDPVHLHLPPHCTLVLYTDGVIEHSRNILEGENKLRDAVHALQPEQPHAAQDLYDALLPAHSRDDVAILTMYVETSAPVQRWRFDPRRHDAASRVRNEITDELVTCGFAPPEIFDFEMIFAELMGNLVRYAPGIVEAILETRPARFVLHVLDKGPGFQFLPRLPSDLYSQSGRGLFVISNLASEFTVEHRPGGGSHARVVLNHPVPPGGR
jgi:anti-sigma regulatory factor (Ser/Thr protein kinase)